MTHEPLGGHQRSDRDRQHIDAVSKVVLVRQLSDNLSHCRLGQSTGDKVYRLLLVSHQKIP